MWLALTSLLLAFAFARRDSRALAAFDLMALIATLGLTAAALRGVRLARLNLLDQALQVGATAIYSMVGALPLLTPAQANERGRPWWPIRGVYLLLESGAAAPTDLVDVDGVGGIWSVLSQDVDARLASAPAGQTLTYCFLDDDPVEVANRLRPVLTARWQAGVVPLLAAPFYPVIPYEWDRHVP